ncbi:hypothetical protein N9L86_02870 [Euryarchaeota archaeon]|nr:hypothetical protein [Euryarchaeota archaeon]
MKMRVLLVLSIFLFSLMTPFLGSGSAQGPAEMEVLGTAVNPANNHTYHLLSASSWEDAADAARGLDGFLTTIDNAEENQWLFETFASFDNQSRHLWTGLSDANQDGSYRWHDGSPFYYNNWGDSQPSEGGDEDYVHIASTNMGNIMPATWNDLENDPQYFPVYGVVEVGEGADFSLRFDGESDHVEVPHDDSLNISNSLYLSAMVYPYSTDGIHFIAMKGDYGWGMYLNNGNLGYASEYSLSKHPTSNSTVDDNTWSHVEIEFIESVGGEFRINGEPAGLISAEESLLPLGDFGSNDCFTSGDACDELYIGSMGAGCECNYFEGMLDNISIGSSLENSSERIWVSNWSFGEGEGSITMDHEGREGTVFGADWVMPDGTIVAQAIELDNDVDSYIESAQAGDQLLFYGDVDDMTKEMYFNMFSWGDFGKDPITIDVYIAHDRVPSSWDHDAYYEAEFSYMWESWSWPEEGNWWFVLVPREDVEDVTITLTWVVADPPPALSEMTELINGIPVTGQSIDSNRQTPFEDRILYYYVNVTEPLSSLSVETYDGEGNINLGLSWLTVPDPFDQWFDIFEPGFIEDDISMDSKMSWSNGPGNEEMATIYDIEPGLYYVSAYTYQRASDFTIKASFTYAPDNIEPEDAIELTPGVAYGPLSGYDGLYQYFTIDVPADTERLEVDLSEGYGEATLFMKYLEAPDAGNYDHLSGSPGAGDKIGFNDPTPGMWYILLYTDEIFANTMITASFEDRYVWSYDGTPIQLFNGEEITGMDAPAGEELYFFIELENPAEYLEITTFGGEGSLYLEGEGNQLFMNWDDDWGEEWSVEEDKGDGNDGKTGGRQGGMPSMDFTSVPVFEISYGEGTEQYMFVSMPANGRFDVTLIATEDVTDVGLVANWFESDIPPVDPNPVDPVDPIEAQSCEEIASEEMKSIDADKDGVISLREYQEVFDEDFTAFDEIDLNSDGELEFREVVQEICSCDNELMIVFSQIATFDRISVEVMTSQAYVNTYNFVEMDTNSDDVLTYEELEVAVLLCTTTFDAFDGDGDGVPDKDDAFPDDPDESVDTDGDGVGDNADIAPSVANDVIYSSGAVLFVMLVGVLVFFLRSNNGTQKSNEWNTSQEMPAFDERMMGLEEKSLPSIDQTAYAPVSEQPNLFESYSPASTEPSIAFSEVSELFSSNTQQAPPAELMGMFDASGNEFIEYPSGSGVNWTRGDATQPWSQD